MRQRVVKVLAALLLIGGVVAATEAVAGAVGSSGSDTPIVQTDSNSWD